MCLLIPDGLPSLFTTMTIFLVVTALILLALSKPVRAMLDRSEAEDARNKIV